MTKTVIYFYFINISDFLMVQFIQYHYCFTGNFVFTTNETNRILNDISFDRVDQPDVNPELNSRPLSGKEARSARSARIMGDATTIIFKIPSLKFLPWI